MKRILLAILCTVMLTTGIVPVNSEDGTMMLKSGETIHIDEQYRELLTSTNSFNTKEINGEKLISVEGESQIIGTAAAGEGFSDFIIEADIQQTSCTGVSSGVFSIGLRSKGSSATQYRLVYVSSLNYNESTKKHGNGEIVKDRLAIVRTSGSDNCSSWYYAAISEKPLGVLKGNATPWIHLRGIMTDDGIEFSAYSEGGKLLSSVSASMHELNMSIVGMPIVEEGGIMLSSHSSNVYVKKMMLTPIDEYKEIKIEPEYSKMYKGQNATVRIVDENGNDLFSEAYSTEFGADNTVSFDKPGTKKISVSAKDMITNEEYTASCDIEVVDKIEFTALEAELSNSGIVCGGSVEYRVWGISSDGIRYNVDAAVSGEGINVDGNTVTSDIPGEKILKFRFDKLETTAKLNVSSFYSIKLMPCRESVLMWDNVHFYAEADTGNGIVTIEPERLEFDKKAFSEESGRLKANRTGTHTVVGVVDSVKVQTEVVVIPKEEGVVLSENFENGEPISEYMQYDTQKLVSDGENTAYKIDNETTDFFGDYEWRNYSIDFKLKLGNSAIEKEQYAGLFEIIPRRRIPADNMFGGDKGIPFVYRTSHNIDAPHMRISVEPGPEINIEDGNWHNVSVEVNGCQMIFSIDDKKMYYSGSFPKQGYFSMRAANITAYIDDVTVTLNKTVNTDKNAVIERVEAEAESAAIPTNDAFSLLAMTPVRAYYSDGTSRYLDIVNEVKWSVNEGADKINLSRNRGIKATKTGDVCLTGEVGGKTFPFKITVYDDGMSDREYAEKTLKKRRETYMYSMQKSYNEGTVKGIGGLGNLASYYGEMLMYPRDRDYSEILKWHGIQAEYEDTIVGRGNDGGDFIILQMINIYNKLKGRINASEESFEDMKEYLCSVKYPAPADWMSENHKGVFYATAILVGETFPDAIMMDGMSGRELNERYTGYMKTWVNQRLKRGFMEYDSAHYYNVDIYTFENLYAVTKNPELKKLAYDMLTYLYADILSDSLEDVMTGAHSRVYAGMAYTTKFKMLEIMFDLSTVAFDELGPEKAVQDSHILFGEYIPDAVIYDMAFEEDRRFENKERRSIYAIPDDLLITDTMEKYTYTTPTYSLGCVVHVDDLEKYRSNEGNYKPVTSTYDKGTRRNIIQGQQEIPWSLHFAGGSDTMIYEGHPGPYGTAAASHAHGYFAGDLHCNCYQYFQDENVSIGMHKITRAGEVKFTHFWLPRNNFDEIYEDSGWIFVNHKGTYAAIKPLKDGLCDGKLYSWGIKGQKYNNAYPLEQVEVRIDSKDTAFVCEVHEADVYGKSFEEFCSDIINNTSISYSVSSEYYVEYTALSGKKLKIDYNNNQRFINGEIHDTHEYKMHESKYVTAEWDAGEIEITTADNSYKISQYLTPIDSETAVRLLTSVKSFEKELARCSKSRLGAFLDSRGQEIEDMAQSLELYSDSELKSMCSKRFLELSGKLFKVGQDELAKRIEMSVK